MKTSPSRPFLSSSPCSFPASQWIAGSLYLFDCHHGNPKWKDSRVDPSPALLAVGLETYLDIYLYCEGWRPLNKAVVMLEESILEALVAELCSVCHGAAAVKSFGGEWPELSSSPVSLPQTPDWHLTCEGQWGLQVHNSLFILFLELKRLHSTQPGIDVVKSWDN